MSCMVPHGVGIVGYAEHDASRRTLPRRSLGQERTCRAGYEVVKVARLLASQLNGSKVLKDAFGNVLIFCG